MGNLKRILPLFSSDNVNPTELVGSANTTFVVHLVWFIRVWFIRVSTQILRIIRVTEYSRLLNKGQFEMTITKAVQSNPD